MKFSVLMSVYDKENPAYLRQSIDSIYNQTLLPDEVILIEDGPLTPELNDTISALNNKHNTLKVIALDKKSGLGGALNRGIQECKNEIIARMDTDDVCKPNRFERQITFMEEHPDIDICSSWVDEFNDDIQNVISQRKLPETHQEIFEYGKRKCPVNHPATVYKKSKVIAAGGYGQFPEDYLLWVKMLMNGCKFYNIQESLVWYRFSADVIQRRGGWTYAIHEISDQFRFYKLGYTNLLYLITNIGIRTTVRLIPSSLRSLIYQHAIRKW